MKYLSSLLFSATLIACSSSLWAASDPNLKNGGFNTWENGLPKDWTATAVRQTGKDGPAFTPLTFEQSGTISQPVTLEPGVTYRLAFTYIAPSVSWELTGVKASQTHASYGAPLWHWKPLAVVELIKVDSVAPAGARLVFKGAPEARLGGVEIAPVTGGFTGALLEKVDDGNALARFGIRNSSAVTQTYTYKAVVTNFYMRPLGTFSGTTTLKPGESWKSEVPFKIGDSPRYRARLTYSEKGAVVPKEEIDFLECDEYGNSFRKFFRIDSADVQMHPEQQPDFDASAVGNEVTFPYSIPTQPVTFPWALDAKGNRKPKDDVNKYWAVFRLPLPANMLASPSGEWHLSVPLAAISPEVIVNGTDAGGAPGRQPINVDLSPFLREKENAVDLRIHATRATTVNDVGEGITETCTSTLPEIPGVGVLAPLWLSDVPRIRVDDVHVVTSFRKSELTLQYTLVNDTRRSTTVEVAPEILYAGDTVMKLDHGWTIVPAQGRMEITVRSPWKNPKLWMPRAPELYQLKTRLSSDGVQIDEHDMRFGFRETWIEGKYVYWNGKKLKLATLMAIPHPDLAPASGAWRALRQFTDNGIWLGRSYAAFAPRYLDFMDEMGILSRYGYWLNLAFADWRMKAPNSDEYWKIMDDHAASFTVEARNHPCILAWSVENESFQCGVAVSFPETFDRYRRLRDIVRGINPGMIIEDDGGDPEGDDDWINLHYPLNPARTIPYQAGYPPKIFEKNKWYGLQMSPGSLVWDESKPLVLGEDFIGFAEGVQSLSLFNDEGVYEVSDKNPTQMKDPYAMDRAYHRLHEPFMIADRDRELAYITTFPITDAGLDDTLQPVAVFLDEPFRHVYSGKKIEFNATVHYDLLDDITGKLSWRLEDDGGKKLAGGLLPLTLEAGAVRHVVIPVTFPTVDARARVRLKLDLMQGEKSIASRQADFSVHPKPVRPSQRIVLYDPEGNTAGALTKAGFRVEVSTHPETNEPFFVGENALAKSTDSQRKDWVRFAEKGGSLIVLKQEASQPDWLPIRLNENRGSYSFAAFSRAPEHPIVKGLDESDLCFWQGPGHRVAAAPYWKPRGTNLISLLDTGNIGGYLTTALAELPTGSGRILLSQLELVSNLNVDPLADEILDRLVDYATAPCYFHADKGVAIRNPSLEGAAKELGLSSDPQSSILLADAAASAQEAGDLLAAVKAGKTLWLVGMNPTVEPAWSSAGLPALNLEAKPRSYVTQAGRHPLLDGLSNSDLFFVGMGLAPAPGAYGSANTQSLSDFTSNPSSKDVEMLLNHGLLERIPIGQGSVLLDLTKWYLSGQIEGQRGKRLPAMLATNLGLKLSPTGEDIPLLRAPADFKPISLESVYNEDLNDALAGNGNTFGGVPFDIHSGAKGAVILGSSLLMPNSPQIPAVTSPVKVDEKFDGVYFLLAAFDPYEGGRGYGSGEVIGGIDIVYQDGSHERMPLMHKVHAVNLFEYMGDLAAATVVWRGPTPFADWLDKLTRWSGNRWIQGEHPNNLYLVRWINPTPEKQIASIGFESSNLHVVPIIIGATGFHVK